MIADSITNVSTNLNYSSSAHWLKVAITLRPVFPHNRFAKVGAPCVRPKSAPLRISLHFPSFSVYAVLFVAHAFVIRYFH